MPTDHIPAQYLIPGGADGKLVVLEEPLSLWGGFDPVTGRIIDVHHPQYGVVLDGRVVAMAQGRGSSSASSVLAEAVRLGTAPLGFVLMRPDEILALGCIVGRELYGRTTPIALVALDDYERLRTGLDVSLDAHGVSVIS